MHTWYWYVQLPSDCQKPVNFWKDRAVWHHNVEQLCWHTAKTWQFNNTGYILWAVKSWDTYISLYRQNMNRFCFLNFTHNYGAKTLHDHIFLCKWQLMFCQTRNCCRSHIAKLYYVQKSVVEGGVRLQNWDWFPNCSRIFHFLLHWQWWLIKHNKCIYGNAEVLTNTVTAWHHVAWTLLCTKLNNRQQYLLHLHNSCTFVVTISCFGYVDKSNTGFLVRLGWQEDQIIVFFIVNYNYYQINK